MQRWQRLGLFPSVVDSHESWICAGGYTPTLMNELCRWTLRTTVEILTRRISGFRTDADSPPQVADTGFNCFGGMFERWGEAGAATRVCWASLSWCFNVREEPLHLRCRVLGSQHQSAWNHCGKSAVVGCWARFRVARAYPCRMI